jgi:hypothetical protein
MRLRYRIGGARPPGSSSVAAPRQRSAAPGGAAGEGSAGEPDCDRAPAFRGPLRRHRRFVPRSEFTATSRTASDVSLSAFRADQDATAEQETDDPHAR